MKKILPLLFTVVLMSALTVSAQPFPEPGTTPQQAPTTFPEPSTQPGGTTQTFPEPGTANTCSPVYTQNYNACCTTYRSQNLPACIRYENNLPGMPGSGAPNTPIFNPTPNPQASAPVPQSGSAELSQCSSIKLLSLLDILIWIKCIIVVAIIPLIFAAALMFFLWGVFKFIAASDSAKKEEGKKFIVAGLIGLFVMTSLWGIIKILGTTLGIESTVPLLQTTTLQR